MPTSLVIQIDPKDLQKNVILGIGLPFNGIPVFNVVYSTKDKAKYKLINLLLTNNNERLYNPNFGCNVSGLLFDQILDDYDTLKENIISNIGIYVPEVVVLDVTITSDIDNNSLVIQISYQMRLSGDPDQITINVTQ